MNVQRFHVPLAHVLESQLGTSDVSFPIGELPVENVFWYAAILHATHVAQPAESALPKKGEHAG